MRYAPFTVETKCRECQALGMDGTFTATVCYSPDITGEAWEIEFPDRCDEGHAITGRALDREAVMATMAANAEP